MRAEGAAALLEDLRREHAHLGLEHGELEAKHRQGKVLGFRV